MTAAALARATVKAEPMQDTAPIRDAATTILVRDAGTDPRVLMGQRGTRAAFMPSKFVFPGGAVDPGDAEVALAGPLAPGCATRLADGPLSPQALAAAAIRELWEETGLMLAAPGRWPAPPPEAWAGFAARGMLPAAQHLNYVFRAITPPGRPRRFAARFYLARAEALAGDPDDFRHAQPELANLQWIPLDAAPRLDLPFITEVVLAELAARLRDGGADGVPFFDNSGTRSEFRRIP